MKSIRTICLALISCSLFTSIANAELYMSVSGKVVDDATKTGIASVAITAFRPTDKNTPFIRATTNQDGSFVLQDLAAGDYQVDVEPKNEYVSTVTIVTVPSGKNVRNVIINLKKSGFITGTITSFDGKPVVNAKIIGISSTGHKRAISSKNDGSYSLGDLIPDSYKIIILADGFAQEEITNVDVVEGQTTQNINFVIGSLDQGIKGTILDDGGNPINKAVVFVNGNQAVASSNSNGNYIIRGLRAGNYALAYFAPGYEGCSTNLSVIDNTWTTNQVVLHKQQIVLINELRSLTASMAGIVPVFSSSIINSLAIPTDSRGYTMHYWNGNAIYNTGGYFGIGGSWFKLNATSECFGKTEPEQWEAYYDIYVGGISVTPLPGGSGQFTTDITGIGWNGYPDPNDLSGLAILLSLTVTPLHADRGTGVGKLLLGTDMTANLTGAVQGVDQSLSFMAGWSYLDEGKSVLIPCCGE